MGGFLVNMLLALKLILYVRRQACKVVFCAPEVLKHIKAPQIGANWIFIIKSMIKYDRINCFPALMPSIPFSFIPFLCLSRFSCHPVSPFLTCREEESLGLETWLLLLGFGKQDSRKSQATAVHFVKNIVTFVTCLHLLPMLPTYRTFSKETLMHWTFTSPRSKAIQSQLMALPALPLPSFSSDLMFGLIGMFGPPGMSWSNANPSFLFHFCQCSSFSLFWHVMKLRDSQDSLDLQVLSQAWNLISLEIMDNGFCITSSLCVPVWSKTINDAFECQQQR